MELGNPGDDTLRRGSGGVGAQRRGWDLQAVDILLEPDQAKNRDLNPSNQLVELGRSEACYFFLPATVLRAPRRVRALVRVR